MSYTHNGVSFFFANETEDEVDEFIEVDNYMNYNTTPTIGAELFTNGIEYFEYDPYLEITDDDTGEVTEEVGEPGEVIEAQGWTLEKLGTPHPASYPGEPNTFGQRVYAVPISIVNKATAIPIEYGLQFSHSSSVYVVELARDLVNDIIRLRVIAGEFNLSIDENLVDDSFFIGEKMVISHKSFGQTSGVITGYTSNNGTIPRISIDYDMTDLECTVTNMNSAEGSIDVELHIDSAYTTEDIDAIELLTPMNQEIMILPLGDGIYIPPDSEDLTVGHVLDDSFSDFATHHGMSSWVYNSNTATMSEPRKASTQMMSFELDLGRVYKFMAIIWKNEENSIFSNGLHLRVPGVL